MNWVLKRFRVVISIAIVLSTVCTYLIVYMPRRDELEYAALCDFIHIASANEHTFDQSIDYALTVTKNLSNIERLSQLIFDHIQGLANYNVLRAETQVLFSQYVQTIPLAIGAIRLVDNTLVGSYGNVKYDKKVATSNMKDIYYEINSEDSEITIYSPIYFENTYLGLDIATFDLSNSITALDNKYQYNLIKYSDENSDWNHSETLNIEGTELFDDGEYIYYLDRINGSDIAFQVSVNKDELFAPIRRITARSLFSAIICNASLLLLTNILLIQIAKYRIKHIERRKDLYKEYAYRDALTGAYSRLYLERWIYTHSNKSKFIHENICIAMLDINNYKLINDSYGHYIGDKVLQYLVKYINETIKDEDFVVRFGGDEFVIVLQNTRLDEAKSLLSEISDKLCNIKEMQLGISISYGIEQVSSYDGVFDGIERADEKMYISKKKYKQTLLYNQFV